jgi:hypothetical protein
MRYLRQHDRSSCGPISVINAVKWCNIPISEKSTLQKLRQDCRCKREQGTDYSGIVLALSNYAKYIEFFTVKKLTIEKVDRHLKKGGATLFCLYWNIQKKLYAHAVLCISKTDKFYKIVNYSGNHSAALQYKKKETIDKCLKLAMKYEGSRAVIFLKRIKH